MRPQQGGSDGGLTEARAPRFHERIDLALASDSEAPAQARTEISGWLAGRVAASVLEEVRLVVSELVTNSVRHAGLRPGEVVELRGELMGDRLRVEVEDPGRAGSVGVRRPEDEREGGFGLSIVETIAVDWGVSLSRGTRIWAELSLL